MAKLTQQELLDLGLHPEALPKHVAIIMDGNGRWAQKRGLPRSFGHRAGVNRLREIIRFSSDAGIQALTLYAFSTENWSRPSDEVGTLMNLLIEYFNNEIEELNENNVCIRALGDIDSMPEKVAEAIHNAERKTATNAGLKLNIALNYGGRAEILRAVRQAAKLPAEELDQLDADGFEQLLYTRGLPSLDLLIRTAGEQRISNFLLFQCAYAEFCFVDDFWPDFTKDLYVKALIAFQKRSRRFGGLDQKK
ncbi:MAG: isoprenyl transferase [Clostridia bacterium]|nr:isoprenyl transferase [Clostridia bacterium]